LIVKRLKLINFRNYEELNIDFSDNYNLIYGDNAQGKTNIIEALFFCATGRSHRTTRDSELIKLNENNFYIKLDLEHEAYEKNIEIGYDKKHKKIKINGSPIRKIGDLMGNLCAVMFSPEDLMIIKEGPAARRRLIDITISQLRPVYFFNLQQYYKVLEQRNNLLKSIKKDKNLLDTLDVWNQNLVNIGTKIIIERDKFIKKLNKYSYEKHLKLTNNEEEIEIVYSPSIRCESYENQNLVKNIFLKNLERLKASELMVGTTMCGPQRDDMDISFNANNLKVYGSQGQQRTAILTMKLATIDVIQEENGQKPILLLDDVMSELDEKRQGYLYENLVKLQTFVTTTEKKVDFKNRGEKIFKVVDGRVFVE